MKHTTNDADHRNYSGAVRIQEAIDELLLDTECAGRRPKTLRYYRQQLELFARWSEQKGVRLVHEITPNLLRQYMASRRVSGLSSDTADAAYRALRRFFYFLVQTRVIKKSPLASVARSKPELPVKEAFEHSEIQKLVAGVGLSARDHAFVLFFLDTGCRVGESLALTWRDISLGDESGKGASVLLRHTKNGRPRTVPLSPRSVTALRRYQRSLGEVQPGAPVWINLQSRMSLTPSGARQLCERIAKQLGIRQANPHKFRRTFALEMLRNGGDVVRIAQLLGHANVSLLYRYLPLTDRDLRDIHRRAGPLSRFDAD